jgi:phosphomannomutase
MNTTENNNTVKDLIEAVQACKINPERLLSFLERVVATEFMINENFSRREPNPQKADALIQAELEVLNADILSALLQCGIAMQKRKEH